MSERRVKGIVYKKLARRNALGLVEDESDVIHIDPRVKGRKHLEILIHEAFHIFYPHWSEDKVIRDSAELTRLLWEKGYRRCDQDDSQTLQDGEH